jgi:hypothetical protein
MGVSLSTVNRAHMAHDRGGLKALEPRSVGGRENMTLAEEAALLAGFARAAGAGEMCALAQRRFVAHRFQSSLRSRCTAILAGLRTLIQTRHGPDR